MSYDVIVVDPPWSYGNKHARSLASNHYSTVGADTRSAAGAAATTEAIANLVPIKEWAAPRCALYVWVTNTHLTIVFDLVARWGFEYKTTLTWVKVTAEARRPSPGMGFFYRGCTEHIVLATQGGYAIPPALREPNVILAERGRHSEKPEAFYDLVERTSPGQTRLDAFARRRRFGWDTWGNES